METKICRKCTRRRPISFFHKWSKNRPGFRPDCKDCRHTERIIYYAETRERSGTYNKNYHAAHQSERSVKGKIFRSRHPEYARVSASRKRAARYGALGSFTARQFLAKCDYHGWRCYLCGTELTFKTMEADHRIPFSRGGTNWIANVAPACSKCNADKREMTEKEFRSAMA